MVLTPKPRFVQIDPIDPSFPFRFSVEGDERHTLTRQAVGWCQQEFGDVERRFGVPAPPRWRWAHDWTLMFASQTEATAFKLRWG